MDRIDIFDQVFTATSKLEFSSSTSLFSKSSAIAFAMSIRFTTNTSFFHIPNPFYLGKDVMCMQKILLSLREMEKEIERDLLDGISNASGKTTHDSSIIREIVFVQYIIIQ